MTNYDNNGMIIIHNWEEPVLTTTQNGEDEIPFEEATFDWLEV